MKKRETLKNAAFFTVNRILVLVFLISGLHILESTVLQNGDIQETTGKKTIVRNGVEYFPRQDITVMLVMGIDQEGPVQDSGYYRNEGAADVVMLLIFDEEAKDYSILYLNRDTMLTMAAGAGPYLRQRPGAQLRKCEENRVRFSLRPADRLLCVHEYGRHRHDERCGGWR